MPDKLQTIKDGFMSPASLTLFRDNLPNVTGAHAMESAKRFAKMCCTAIIQNPALQSCTLPSLVKAASQSASLDLDIDVRGLAYLIPYKNQATFQVGYLGLIELAYRSGKVKIISAHCIYESERKSVTITRTDGQYTVKHPFSYEKATGDIIAVYATAEIDGIKPQTIVLRADEVEKFRELSKAPDSPAWKHHKPAMYKKTAIRQLAKFLPKSILEEFSRGAAMDEHETFVEAQVSARKQIQSQAGSEEIEAELEDEQPQGEATDDIDEDFLAEQES